MESNRDAVNFLRVLSDCFLLFEKDEFLERLIGTISVEPSDKLFIRTVYPSMQTKVIAKSGQPIVLPGKLRILIGGKLEGNDLAITGKLTIDLQKFSQITGEIARRLQSNTRKLRL